MKIGIACFNHKISEHFGKSDELRVFDVCDERYEQIKTFHVDRHEHEGFIQLVIKANLDLIICGNLGQKARKRLELADIEIISGAHGDIEEVMNQYMRHELISIIDDCEGHHHHDHHEHS